MRLRSYQQLPRKYPFLTRHSAKSFMTYHTYDFSSAAFVKRLRIPHGLPFAPLHDMWMAFTPSITGDATRDYPFDIEGVIHTPYIHYQSGTKDVYYCYTDEQYVYVYINHVTATSGTNHVYFHVKLYADPFDDIQL